MKRIATMLVAIVLTFTLGACTAIQRATEGEAPAGEESKSFTYWSMWSEGEPQQVMAQKAIDEFTAETGIEVKVEWIGRDNMKKLSPTLNSPESPADLVDAAQRNIKSVLASTDSSLSMNPVLDANIPGEDVTVRSVIPEEYWDMVTDDGDTWMVPYQVISSAFWYNGATHPELDGQYPKTWDEFIAWLEAAKAEGATPIAQDGDIANFNLYYFAELAVRNTGPGELNAAAGDPSGEALKAEGFVNAAKQVQQLVDGGYFVDGYSSSKWPAMQQKWAENEAELIYNGTWIPHETKASAGDEFEYRAFPMPEAAPGGNMSQEVSFIGFGIPAKAPNAEAAQEFITYFMNKERLSRVSSEVGNMTPRGDIEVPEALTDIKQMIDDAPAVHGQFDQIIDDHGDWTTKVLIPLTNQLVFGEISAEEFSAQLPATSAEYWKNNA
ncbi:extracellular solute-binding protein [Tessaracoccus sp. OS52]|uniref:ABC transporter substrate-binding protein n=1 Tax=Tessaracoccus sp. OS52 TaxID=2886691 RepID=UPI001D123F77|nr:extracellular solute-binding protein [Tessaracoccus sp. OS52]MCC2593691.1 extracellular solute-binding protein [Tessaracoccus sp. OS52]